MPGWSCKSFLGWSQWLVTSPAHPSSFRWCQGEMRVLPGKKRAAHCRVHLQGAPPQKFTPALGFDGFRDPTECMVCFCQSRVLATVSGR